MFVRQSQFSSSDVINTHYNHDGNDCDDSRSRVVAVLSTTVAPAAHSLVRHVPAPGRQVVEPEGGWSSRP